MNTYLSLENLKVNEKYIVYTFVRHHIMDITNKLLHFVNNYYKILKIKF